ncbi:MAG: outer membrane protein assembly factor BamE [Oleispira antarctica]|uniref:Outer membrane protein assembly factor BamE n=1 Tax=Oleispira antarctica RB-8 TaxID=698738 RepID=R4YKC8_OLEAN|nr:outer membrane protein assembly factor BamE [Oleispira antarctica]MBQ0791381.1 outer membrane protein assembly factor BamE [Oleispira antarctica]CCK74857.1 probable outer membrane lipoprotein, OmlA-like [Oleispira antarctica RB-8]|tara:strand:+ start:1088 stop:1480 length:393 start_codon:yes stop_codon:yes gene_type:complete
MQFRILTVLLSFLFISACSIPKVYKLTVQQGNIVTQDMIDELKIGMTKRQVAYVMGTPLIRSPYQQNRWDYLYTLERRDKVVKEYQVTVFFEDDIYTHIEGEVPQEDEPENQQEVLEDKKENNLLEIPSE